MIYQLACLIGCFKKGTMQFGQKLKRPPTSLPRVIWQAGISGRSLGSFSRSYTTVVSSLTLKKEYRSEPQRRGISKPLVSRALQLLSTFHERAYLATQTTSYKAVKIYLDFGFRPYITDESQKTGWSVISRLMCLPEHNIHYGIL